MADLTLAKLLQQEDPAAFYRSQRNHAYVDSGLDAALGLGTGAVAAMLAAPGSPAKLLPMGAIGRWAGAPSMGMMSAASFSKALDNYRRAQLYDKVAKDTPAGAEGGLPALPNAPY